MSPHGETYTYSNSTAPLYLELAHSERRIVTLGSWTGPEDDGVRATGIADGAWIPGSQLEDVGRGTSLHFWFAMPGWTWRAELLPLTDDPDDLSCWRKAVVTSTGDQTFTVDATGPKGTYRLSLYGEGPQGDQGADVRWTTVMRGRPTPRRCAG